MSDSAAADQTEMTAPAPEPTPSGQPTRAMPLRPDGWPDWLGRRPITSADRDKILTDLHDSQSALAATERRDGLQFAPHFSYLTINGLDRETDPRKRTRLRASINAACRVAAGDRRTSYHATDQRITIGIAAPDAHQRLTGLRQQLTRMGRNRGWTITDGPSD